MSRIDSFHNPSFVVKDLDQRFPAPSSPGPGEPSALLYVRDDEVLVSKGRSGPPSPVYFIPSGESLLPGRYSYLGVREGVTYYGVPVGNGDPLPPGSEFIRIRDLALTSGAGDAGLAAFAASTVRYDRNTRFCGRCGAGTQPLLTERGKVCPSCGLVTYPRISPAVIVLVTDPATDRALLARSSRFPDAMYSIIAGFVQPGETIEDTVRREVHEETAVRVRNIRYAGSEPWPFPDSLMIGFLAEYAGGTVTPDGSEVVSAGWFSRDNLPLLPNRVSISRALLDLWINDPGRV